MRLSTAANEGSVLVLMLGGAKLEPAFSDREGSFGVDGEDMGKGVRGDDRSDEVLRRGRHQGVGSRGADPLEGLLEEGPGEEGTHQAREARVLIVRTNDQGGDSSLEVLQVVSGEGGDHLGDPVRLEDTAASQGGDGLRGGRGAGEECGEGMGEGQEALCS